MEKRLRVCWWDGATVGHLIHRGPIYFVYDETWLRRGVNLSPISLPFTDIAFNGSKGIEKLPGLIGDCLPDAWGRKVARAEFAARKWGEPNEMSLLAWRGPRGLGALKFLPPMDEGNDPRLERVSAAALARGAAEIERGEPSEVLPQLARGGSAGGVFPKSIVLAYPDGSLRVGDPDAESVPGLIKFDLSEDGAGARSEHIFACMARAAGIHAVETRLLEEAPGSARRHLFVTRFDVPVPGDPKRIHFHSASGLLHKGPGDLDYRDLFRLALRLHVEASDLREIASRMVFNSLASNMDDHGKNHAFQLDGESGRWSLTPAYDITFSAGMLGRGMAVAGEVWPRSGTMESLCRDAGIASEEYRAIFDAVDASLSRWPDLAETGGISRAGIREVAERFARIKTEALS